MIGVKVCGRSVVGGIEECGTPVLDSSDQL